ncbi:MAG TPA: TetR/AcrR family transcriptional regulator [Rubrobacteraceae bacterium]|jgi:AcrR family transcriptional regulator|nr:TetR/AcrR family transcriptional regulator [Rubrobacteraceae bacterium]
MVQKGETRRGKYELKRRAERQEETRRRIVETAVELHRTYGPAQTTITDIARMAGVERKTVYNHFPDELSLFEACSAHNRSLNPPPDPEGWTRIGDPEVRLRKALAEVYAYYRRNEQMTANVTRDAQANANVRKVLEPRIKHQERMRDALAAGWEQGEGTRRQRLVYGALWVALEFQTWRALVRQEGFEDEEVIELMVGMVRCAMFGEATG